VAFLKFYFYIHPEGFREVNATEHPAFLPLLSLDRYTVYIDKYLTSMIIRKIIALIFLLAFAYSSSVMAQTEASDKDEDGEIIPWNLYYHLSDDSGILLLSSIEYGIPERLSLSTMYIKRIADSWSMNFILSPGVSGFKVRTGITYGWQQYHPLIHFNFALIRTWGSPIKVKSKETICGIELRASAIILMDIGYYLRISDIDSKEDKFFGVHFGIGI
jgi:hypothetical protein